MTTKKDIRKHFLEQRLNLDDLAAATLNAQLLENCRGLDFSRELFAHVFLPIASRREVDTWSLIRWMQETWPALQWALSRSNLSTGDMEHFIWTPATTLVSNKYGIPEPDGGTRVLPEVLDLVFVPLLAFDRKGHRVGYGKGMYDRFLQQCRPGVRTIGLSLFEPVEKIEDISPADVPLQTVVTPYFIYHFHKQH